MKITVGVKSVKEAGYFLTSGADEVYCGLIGLHNNRLPRENLSGPGAVEEIIKLARARGKKVFVAANEIVHEKEYALTLRLLTDLKAKGLSGVIVRDPALLAYFKKNKFRFYFTLSTLANCFNSKALGFFADLGVSRLVLPMQMMPENSAGLVKNRFGIETEVFCQALYYGINVDSLCSLPCPQTGQHVKGGFRDFTCLLPFKNGAKEFFMPMPGPDYMLNAFYDHYKSGIGHLKVARWPNTLRQIDLFHKARYLLKLLEKGISRKLFVHEGRKLDAKPLEYGKSFTFKPFAG
ncbi:MAG: U32 family peptidase [Elusimicrobiota bacterium]